MHSDDVSLSPNGASAATPGDMPGVVTVYHDGACPLCRREIAFFRKRVEPGAVSFVDVSRWEPGSAAGDRSHDLDPAAAMARFHVRDGSGRLLSGARAFAELWTVTPGFRRLGRVAQWPPVTAILEVGYRLFLRVRPALQRFAGCPACTLETDAPRSGCGPGR